MALWREEGESGAPIPTSVKSAVSSANNASWTPDDDGRGISFVYAEYSRGEGWRNSCSDKTSCRVSALMPKCEIPACHTLSRPWLHQRQLRCYVRFQSPPRHTLLSGGLAVTRMGWAKAELFIYDKAEVAKASLRIFSKVCPDRSGG
ncbi:hypothetical protein EVAR_3275_1 [Eumeta japonica]|uniref:Uncharacterized protein n=1 Tax=Eumeta variegata TaxID=151549 RepID=A0A4C1SVU8_EUMVA|nr:hypothetical protein EVAR_3275_1 [Eumeta japonica]